MTLKSNKYLYVNNLTGYLRCYSFKTFKLKLYSELLIDNSISAGAKNIEIFCGWKDQISTVEIADDGHGMTREELIDAMTIGAKSPLDPRDESDLGRFGLGL